MHRTQKILITLVFAGISVIVAVILLRIASAPDSAGNPREVGGRTGGSTESRVASGLPNAGRRDSPPALGSHWLRESPATTVSNSPADIAKNRPGSRENPCRSLEGHWRTTDKNELVLEPDGRAIWQAREREPTAASWECRKAGDVRLQLADGTIVLTPDRENRLLGRSGDGQGSEWSRVGSSDN